MAAFFLACVRSKAPSFSWIASRRFSIGGVRKKTGKFYFAASIRSGREDVEIYRQLIDYIKVHGHVLSENEQLGPDSEREARGTQRLSLITVHVLEK